MEADTDRRLWSGRRRRSPAEAVALGLAVAVGTLLLRAGLATSIPGVPPYAMSFPAVLVATLTGGRWAGLACLTVSQLGAWYFFLEPRFSFRFRDTAAGVGFAIASASVAIVWWTATLYRRERSRTLALERRRLEERQSTLDELLGLLDNAHSFMALLRGPELRLTYLNQAYLDLIGETRAIVGKPLLEARPHAAPRFVELMRRVLETGQAVRFAEMETPILRGDGGTALHYLDFVYEPVLAADGTVDGVFIEGHDVTEAVLSRRVMEDNERRLRLAVEASELGVWEWRLSSGEMVYSRRAREICGFALHEPVTYEMVAAITHPDDYPITSAQAERMRDPKLKEQAPFEYRLIKPSGEIRWVLAHGEVVFQEVDGEERAVLFVGTLMDITERKAREEQLTLLAHEVDHRSNNLLTLVQGTIVRSHAADAEALKSIIAGRVQALARSHQLLSASRWTGASLMGLLQEELEPFALGEEERIAIRGENGVLAPQTAQALAMCIHELVTNATKYGALKSPEGRVRVQVRRVDETLCRIVWTEAGGPQVKAPKRQGFGSAVLSRALSSAGGEVRLDWRPEGLVCDLLVPTIE